MRMINAMNQCYIRTGLSCDLFYVRNCSSSSHSSYFSVVICIELESVLLIHLIKNTEMSLFLSY